MPQKPPPPPPPPPPDDLPAGYMSPGAIKQREDKLHNALRIVQNDAIAQQKRHEAALKKRPLQGWSQEKHEKYYITAIVETEAVQAYCFVRMMQISPD